MVCCCGLSAFISVVILVKKLCFIQDIKRLNFLSNSSSTDNNEKDEKENQS